MKDIALDFKRHNKQKRKTHFTLSLMLNITLFLLSGMGRNKP